MPSKSLPSRPSLDHLKYQAKDLLNGHRARKLEAFSRIRQSHPKFAGRGDHEIQVARLSLSDAQLVVAREYGFQSWAKLKRHVESLNRSNAPVANPTGGSPAASSHAEDRKSTRLNSSHPSISYAVFCLKKKNKHR